MRKAYCKFFFIVILLAALLAGCGEENRVDTAKGGNNTGDSSVQEAAEASIQEEASMQKEESRTSQISFTCQDMDGNVVSEAVFSESKLTMVNVWATYCNPCLREMPSLGELAGEYESREFQIIGIISDVMEGADEATMDNAAALIEATGASYTHLLLNESVYYALLTEVTAVPTTFFVNENGEVVDTVIGAMEKTAWEDKINALLQNN
ncbi:MAG: TlpA family protein disulfide reductase [Lachnospiraceae bacterium]|nr:TlpA family protein disulfide reductase [Lachnospiraceae bacterium]